MFHRGSVAELAPDHLRSDVGTHLLALVRKEFVRPDRAQLPGDDGYRFSHVLIRDAAYEAMAKELRAELHDRFASWLELVAGDHLGELEEILGYHLEQAALYRRELDLPDESETRRRASELLARAGTRAYDRGDPAAAENLLARAAALLPPGDALRLRVLPLLGASILGAREMERALEVLHQALDEAVAAGDPVAEASAWALHRLVAVESVPGTDVERLHDEVAARAAEVEQLGDARALVFLLRLELDIENILVADHLSGTAERLLAAARVAGDRLAAFHGLFFLNAAGVFGSTPVNDALVSTQRSKALAEGPLEEAAVENIEGLLRGMHGELDEGRRLIRNARAVFAEFALWHAVGTARDEALIERYAGDAAAAERALRPACDQLRAAGETSSLSTLVAELAEALYELGRYDESERATGESELTTQHADAKSQLTWRRVRAKLLARRGEERKALQLAHEAIEWADRSKTLEDIGDAYRDLAEVERLGGRLDAAAVALEQALAAYERKGLVPMAERTRRELEELRASS
jgi:tetratricopeptide (TPR) repeat protein